MRYGLREIANVMLKAKVDGQKVGNQVFAKGQPVCHFTSLKTSTLEGAATTVYATGGRGNARLIAWEGERTLTLTMEDALISPMGIAILTGAGLIESNSGKPIITHYTEIVEKGASGFTVAHPQAEGTEAWACAINSDGDPEGRFYPVSIKTIATSLAIDSTVGLDLVKEETPKNEYIVNPDAEGAVAFLKATAILVDYYGKITETGVATQIDIEPGKFGGNYYLEAETLMRDEATGRDDAAEFILPNCRIQSNFTFTMASSGDPSTFTFTVDAFPGAVIGTTKKVLCAIQIVNDTADDSSVDDPYWKKAAGE